MGRNPTLLDNVLSWPNLDNMGICALVFQYEYNAVNGRNSLMKNNAFSKIVLKITSSVKEAIG